MTNTTDVFDLIVIGGGTAGIVASQTAASLGAKTLLVERERTGGDCLWTGCVPSKALISIANRRAANRDAAPAFHQVMAEVHAAISEIAPVDSPEKLRSYGITVVEGNAIFSSPQTIDIGGKPYSFRKAIIATGAAPAIPSIPGLSESHYLTSDSIWQLNMLPEKLVIVGAGSIGCELGQAFSRLGSQVTLIEKADCILPMEDPEASEVLTNQFLLEGISLVLSSTITSVETDGEGKGKITLTDANNQSSDIEFDQLLIATGRTPRTSGLGLAAAGISTDTRGFVTTTSSLRTSNKNVWAAGDVTVHPQFTHVAGVHASSATLNAVLGLSRKAEVHNLPWVTFTQPEIAAVGVASTTSSKEYKVLHRSHAEVDRAIADSQQSGFTKVVIDRKGKIVGGLSVSPRAGETLAEISLAISQGLTTKDVAMTMHAYPTYSDGFWNIAIDDLRSRLSTPTMKMIYRILKRVNLRKISTK